MHTPLNVISLTLARELCVNGQARALRLRHRLSLGELAAAVGSTPATLAAWETGRKRPRASAAFGAYMDILGELLALEAPNTSVSPAGRPGSRRTCAAVGTGRNVKV
jgi:DNA-binding XRE family transcriptional regulator